MRHFKLFILLSIFLINKTVLADTDDFSDFADFDIKTGLSKESESSKEHETIEDDQNHNHGKHGKSGNIEDQTGRFTGVGASNIARFNESCGSNGKNCDRLNAELFCLSNNRCGCEEQYVYDEKTAKCLQISMKSSSYTCESDSQCQKSPREQHSRCQKINTYSNSGVCNCYDHQKRSESPEDVVLIGEKCWKVLKINDPCETNLECNKTIKGQASCYVQGQDGRRCHCDFSYIWDETWTNECLRIPEMVTPNLTKCKADIQCKNSNLGRHSRCNRAAGSDEEGRCICAPESYTPTMPSMPTVFYNGKCFLQKSINEPCQDSLECQASIHPDAICSEHPAYLPGEKVCQCPEGTDCSSSANIIKSVLLTSLYILISLGILKTIG